ncbi:Coiled-coil domain-containing protein 38, partial [Camelus dromedarius]
KFSFIYFFFLTEKAKDESGQDRPYKIFFKDLFLFKENEMAAKKKEKFMNRSMKVYQKSTFSSRMKSRSHLGQIATYTDTAGSSIDKFGLDPTLILSAAQETINKLQMTAELKKASMEIQSVKRKWLRNQAFSFSFFFYSQAESISSEDSLEFFLDDDMDYDLEPELYFKEPEELLQVLTELEEQNLTLVQYSQDVDENLEDVNKRERLIQDKINTNIEFLLEHKEMLKANCVREEEKAAELELRSRLFSFGEFNSDAQEKLIDSLSKKINQVYKVCIGDAEVGSLNPVQKLVKVESRLVELSDLIESIPKENVEAIERMKQKERRQKYSHYLMISLEQCLPLDRLREEKMKEKQKHQEERLKAALERAVAQPKKKV